MVSASAAGRFCGTSLVCRQLEHSLARRIRRYGNVVEPVRQLVISDNHDLRMRMRHVHRGNPIGCGEQSVLRGHARNDLNGLLRLVPQRCIIGVGVQPQQSDGGNRISGGSRGILERLAPCAQNAQDFLVG